MDAWTSSRRTSSRDTVTASPQPPLHPPKASATRTSTMRKGFLTSTKRAAPSASAAMKVTMIAGASMCSGGSVDNLLAAASVRERKAAGASNLIRVECDFVTCSQ